MGGGCMMIFSWIELYRKNIFLWLPAYVRGVLRKREKHDSPLHVMFCFVDHYEPGWQRPDLEIERARVARWCREYPSLAEGHQDADGQIPKHCFFYPEEEYREEHLRALSNLCARGFGEIEIHLHHDRDTEEGLREKIKSFIAKLVHVHDALPWEPATGDVRFAFIHGNWALDNSRKDGRWCGINNELRVLRDLGCYADFTLPSAPSDTQTAKINSIYYASDDPTRPKSHNRGVDVEVGKAPSGDLMIIPGPLGFNWKRRKFGIFPRIENAEIRRVAPPTPDRIDLWIKAHVHVKGRPEWCFVKIHTHGAQEEGMDTLLGKPVDDMYSYLEQNYNDGLRYVLHYLTAREMYNIVKAAEDGHTGNPNIYRDYRLKPPSYSVAAVTESATQTSESKLKG
jgi:hypothetical protein